MATNDNNAPGREEITQQLQTILASDEFQRSPRMSQFLKYIVEETLNGNGKQLKAYSIAVDVFKRGADFDSQTDPLVRVQASRLRKLLDQFNIVNTDQVILIQLKKGSYEPQFKRREIDTRTTQSSERFATPKIAVMRVENRSKNTDLDYFAEGLTDELITNLSHFKKSLVLADSVSKRGDDVDLALLRENHKVTHVLEGSIRSSGSRIRVSSQLLETEGESLIWAERYEHDLSEHESFDLQSAIADNVVSAIATPYGIIQQSDQVKAESAATSDAYSWVLKFYRYWTGEASMYKNLREGLETCVRVEPYDSDAWAALAFLYLDEFRMRTNQEYEDIPAQSRALKAARRAVELAPESGMAKQALFCVHYHRNEIAKFHSIANMAMKQNPNHTDVLAQAGIFYSLLGDWDRALEVSNKAIELNPYHPGWYRAVLVLDHITSKRYEEALVELDLFNTRRIYWYSLFGAVTNAHLENKEKAKEFLDMLNEINPNFMADPNGEFDLWNVENSCRKMLFKGLEKAGMKIPD